MIIGAQVNFKFTNTIEQEFLMMVQNSECDSEFIVGFSNRPKDNTMKAHSFVRAANDFMK